MLKLGTKCWISAFNAQGSKGITVAAHEGAVKFPFTSPPWMLMYFFAGFLLNLTLCMTKLGGGVLEQDVNPVNSQYQNTNTLA